MFDFATLADEPPSRRDPSLVESVSIDSESTSAFWKHPHISRSLLAAHLDEGTDAASRRPGAIKATIEWLQGSVLAKASKILDLGCGPGLYAETLAAAGHEVTGLDFSAGSIAHARASAARKGLAIRYVEGSYLEADLSALADGGFDAAMMIYCDLGALSPADRSGVLANVLACLKPGGAFVFDLFGPELYESTKEGRNWDIGQGGFWSEKAYLHLEYSRKYPDSRTLLRAHIVAEADGRIERYVFRDCCFDAEGIKALALEAGFASCEVRENILPPSRFAQVIWHTSLSHCILLCTERPPQARGPCQPGSSPFPPGSATGGNSAPRGLPRPARRLSLHRYLVGELGAGETTRNP